jgi:AraC-like DNA-binding protein
VPPRERFSLWREALAPTHEVILPEGCDPGRFSASACSHHLGSALVLESRATPQRLLRSPRATRLDQIDHYILRLQISGSWTGDIGGRSVTAGPGSVMVLDMARACDARTTDIENINLMLPRDALDDELAPFDTHGLVLRDGMAALLRSHLSALAANLPRLEAADAGRIAAATLSLAAACLAPSRDAVERARAPLETALIAEIRRYIDRHLHAPDLSPHKVGAALGLSRSALYAACAPMGGVAAFIQQRRLKRAHAILTDPRDRRRIAEVAEQYGFVSGAHFSRAFRNAFGYSPSEAREVGEARVLPPDGPAASADTAYGDWVSRLGA